jgi:hypothetical protein
MRKLLQGMMSWRLLLTACMFMKELQQWQVYVHAGIVPLMIVMRKNAEKYEELQDTTAPS